MTLLIKGLHVYNIPIIWPESCKLVYTHAVAAEITLLSMHADMYGDNCTVLCEPRDDTLGHYTCGSAGERVCLEGYGNPDTNCSECAVADRCCT